MQEHSFHTLRFISTHPISHFFKPFIQSSSLLKFGEYMFFQQGPQILVALQFNTPWNMWLTLTPFVLTSASSSSSPSFKLVLRDWGLVHSYWTLQYHTKYNTCIKSLPLKLISFFFRKSKYNFYNFRLSTDTIPCI